MPFIPIRSDLYPQLRSVGSPQTPLQWHYGPLFTTRLTSDFLRVSKYNIQWYSINHKVSDMRNWNVMPCYAVMDSLCEVSDVDTNMLLFPTTEVDIPLDFRHLKLPASYVVNNLTCNSATSNRQLSFNDTRYEISLCDLVDGALEFVLDLNSERVYWRQNTMNSGWLIFLTLTSLFFFTKVCEHSVDLINGRRAEFSHTTSTVPLLTVAWFAFETFRGRSFLLSAEEFNLQLLLIAYVIFKTARPLIARSRLVLGRRNRASTQIDENVPLLANEPHAVSILDDNVAVGALIATQLVLTANMHFTYDTPFLSILVFFFGSRSFLKFINQVHIHMHKPLPIAAMRTFLLSFDTVIFVALLDIAVRIAAVSPQSYIMHACSLVLLSMLTGSLMAFITYK